MSVITKHSDEIEEPFELNQEQKYITPFNSKRRNKRYSKTRISDLF